MSRSFSRQNYTGISPCEKVRTCSRTENITTILHPCTAMEASAKKSFRSTIKHSEQSQSQVFEFQTVWIVFKEDIYNITSVNLFYSGVSYSSLFSKLSNNTNTCDHNWTFNVITFNKQ